MNYSSLYRSIGVRSIGDVLNPKTVKADTFKFPKMSALFYLGDTIYNRNLKHTDDILKCQEASVMLPIIKYQNQIGNPVKNSVKVDRVISDYKKDDNGHKYLKDTKQLLLATPGKLVIYNYAALPIAYNYRQNKDLLYNRFINSLTTLITDLSDDNTTVRNRFFLVELPHTFPKIGEFRKALKYSNRKISTIFDTPKLLLIFELYKLLSKEHKTESAFNKIKNLEDVNFIFKFGNSLSLFNIKYFLSMVKDYNISTKISAVSSKTAASLFLYHVLNVIKSEPLPLEDLSKGKVNYNKFTVLSPNDVGDIESKMKDIESVMDSELEENVSNDLDVDEALDAKLSVVDRRISAVEVKTVDEIINETHDVYSKAEETLKNKMLDGDITEKELAKQLEALKEQEKSGILKKSKVTKEDLTIDADDVDVADSPSIIDKTMLRDPIKHMGKKYVNKVYKKDITNVIYGMQNSGVVVNDYEVEESKSVLGTVEVHKVMVTPPGGRKITLKFNLPKLHEDGSFMMSGNNYKMRKQRVDAPIKKIGSDQVGLTSFYGKIFVSKAYYKKDDAGHVISRELTKMNVDDDSKVKLLVRGTIEVLNIELPLLYTTFGKYTKSFKFGQYYFSFDYPNRLDLIKNEAELKKIEVKGNVLIGKSKNGFLVMDLENKLFEYSNGKYTELDDLLTMLNIDLTKLPVEYSTIRLMKNQMPVALYFLYHMGISKLLKSLNVKVKSMDINKRYALESDEYMVKFSDTKLVFTRNDKLGSMILGGLKSIQKEIIMMELGALDNRDGVISLLTQMGYNRRHLTEIKLLDTMFIDPITKSILEDMKEPTTFKGLLFRSNELLLTDYSKHSNSIETMLVKGNDRIPGLIYKEMVTSLKDYENKKGLIQAKLAINPYAVWSKMNDDSGTMLVDDINPIASLRQDEEVSYLGAFGRDKATMSKKTRAYNPSEVGIISEGSKDSGDVGITTYLSASPNFKNLRGVPDVKDMSDLHTSDKFSTSALMSPGSLQDDPKRLGFVSIQNGHTIPMANQIVLPVRTGYESVISNRLSDKYVMSAIDDGVVKSVDKKEVVISYKKEGVKKYRLYSWTTKEEGGVTFKHDVITSLVKGSKISNGDTITYDKLFFEQDMFDKSRVVFKTGGVIRLLMVEEEETYEDSFATSESMARNLAAGSVKTRSIVLREGASVKDILNVGDKVDYNSSLMTIIPSDNEDYNTGLDLSENVNNILSEIKNKSPNAKVSGKIHKIVVYYNMEKSDIPKEILPIVNASDKYIQESTGDKSLTGKVNSSYSIKGTPLLEGELEIKFYIETVHGMEIGDKAVLSAQLKCTLGETFSDNVRSKDGVKIEGKFSRRSVGARIVNSADIVGTTTTILIELTKQSVGMYFGE